MPRPSTSATPAARAASPRPTAERPRRRGLRILLLVLGVLGFTAYFAFSTFLFNPLEGSFGRIEFVVPATVDFFVRKADLARDFEGFPRPRGFGDLEASPAWRAFLESEDFVALDRKHALRGRLDELEGALRRAPAFDLLRDLLGREVAVAGTFHGPDLAQASAALYARVSWRVKLALGAVRYGWLRARFAPDLEVRRGPGDTLVFGGVAGGRDLHVARDRDLLVASTDPALVRAAREFVVQRGRDSLGLSAKFHDGIEVRRSGEPGADEVEFDLDVLGLSQALGRPFQWPSATGSFGERLAASVFSAASVREASGVARFRDGLDLRLRLDLNADLLGPVTKKLYGWPAAEFARDVTGLAALAPRKVFLLGFARGDVGDLARAAFNALGRDAQRLLHDRFKGTGRYPDALAFLDELAGVVRDRVGGMLRRNDYPRRAGPVEQGGDPPNDGWPGPCWTSVFWMRNREKVREILDFFLVQRTRFAVEKTFTIPVTGGHQAWEFHSPQVPGTGEIAVLTAGDLLFVGNSYKFLQEILEVWVAASPGRKLLDDPEFEAGTRDLGASPNLFVYANGPLWAENLRELAPGWVEGLSTPDYASERPKAKSRIARERYPQYAGKTLPKEVEEEVERAVDAEMERLTAQARSREEPKLLSGLLDRIRWLDAAPSVSLLVSTDPRRIEAEGRLRVRWQ
ncbi:MAG TPA: hypothetical protein VFI25_10430 [Planctomycetota bacterium]|jgi:hypothetical protein|nr:hypothetical protein [Planctomycetota bacterium]